MNLVDESVHNTYVAWCNNKNMGKPPTLGYSNCDARCGYPYPNSSAQGWCECIHDCSDAPRDPQEEKRHEDYLAYCAVKFKWNAADYPEIIGS